MSAICYSLFVSENIISVIIPALNEEAVIEGTLRSLTGISGVEIIVVDGGSSDNTVSIAKSFSHRVISAPRGRASQMNAGARAASGNILFFLHSDCLPPPAFGRLLTGALELPGVIAGAFDIRIGHGGKVYRIIERMANLRSRLTGIPYGDQGLFISRTIFESNGGFSDIPIMEDIDMGQRLKRTGRIRFISDHPVTVSPRRWLGNGILRTTITDWVLALAYGVLGVQPEKLASYYEDVR